MSEFPKQEAIVTLKRATMVGFTTMVALLLFQLVTARAVTDTIGGTLGGSDSWNGYLMAVSGLTASATGQIDTIGIHWADANSATIQLCIYSDNSGKPQDLIDSTNGVSAIASAGWQDIAVTNGSWVVSGHAYWLAWVESGSKKAYYNSVTDATYPKAGTGSCPSSLGSAPNNAQQTNMRINYTVPETTTTTTTAPPTTTTTEQTTTTEEGEQNTTTTEWVCPSPTGKCCFVGDVSGDCCLDDNFVYHQQVYTANGTTYRFNETVFCSNGCDASLNQCSVNDFTAFILIGVFIIALLFVLKILRVW